MTRGIFLTEHNQSKDIINIYIIIGDKCFNVELMKAHLQ